MQRCCGDAQFDGMTLVGAAVDDADQGFITAFVERRHNVDIGFGVVVLYMDEASVLVRFEEAEGLTHGGEAGISVRLDPDCAFIDRLEEHAEGNAQIERLLA